MDVEKHKPKKDKLKLDVEKHKPKKDKLKLNVEKHKKNKIKTFKNKKPKLLDFKVRFNVLTFLTYICRNNNTYKIVFITNC